MDINGALDAMTTEKRTPLTPEEIRRVQDWMILKGYRETDPATHAKLAAFLGYRKRRQTRRALCLLGNVGSGKTMWLRMFGGCRMYTAAELVSIYQHNRERYNDILTPPTYATLPAGYWDLIIDDIGDEPTLNDYGTKLEVIADAIATRYTVFQRHGGYTYLSSNLELSAIKSRYGMRAESRIHEMCTVVAVNAPDQRKQATGD